VRLKGPRLVLLTGVFLVGVGAGCLYLSDAVAVIGSWWQATLDAFGVGFVVGGVVDVTAISLLNQALAGYSVEIRRKRNLEAQDLINQAAMRLGEQVSKGSVPLTDRDVIDVAMVSANWQSLSQRVGDFIAEFGNAIDPSLRDGLEKIQGRVNDALDAANEVLEMKRKSSAKATKA